MSEINVYYTKSISIDSLYRLSGGQYNLISFDPRYIPPLHIVIARNADRSYHDSGTSTSNLPFTCYDNEFELHIFADARTAPNADDEAALGRLWTQGTIYADTCAQKHNETGTLIGTAFTARDVMSIAESIGEDGLLRYWGKL